MESQTRRVNGTGKGYVARRGVTGYVLAGLVVLIVGMTCDVNARNYAYFTVYQETLRTDMWVRASVLKSRMTNEHESVFDGPVHDLELSLEILDSTDPSIPDTIDVVIPNTDKRWKPGDGERILALTRKNGEFILYFCSGMTYGIYPSREDGNTAFLHIGSEGYLQALVKDTFAWSLLRDTRLLVDGDGKVPQDARARWEAVIRNGDPAEVCLALEWFDQLKKPAVDWEALAKNVLRNYTRMAAGVAADRDAPEVRKRFFLSTT